MVLVEEYFEPVKDKNIYNSKNACYKKYHTVKLT